MTEKRTYQEYLDYLRDIVKLKLWFARHWLSLHPEEEFSTVIRQRIDIIRKTGLYNVSDGDFPDFENPTWLELEKKAFEVYEATKKDSDSNTFENEAYKVFQGEIEKKAPKAFAEYSPAKNFKSGSLTYHEPDKNSPGVIAVHIANALMPESIFDDPLYLPNCMLMLLEKSEAEFGVSILHCGTWLNSHPRWLELFPQEWLDDMSLPDENIQWHLGFWGQFITARGTFHRKNAMKFRESGKMPFAFRESDCSFESLRTHLTKYILDKKEA